MKRLVRTTLVAVLIGGAPAAADPAIEVYAAMNEGPGNIAVTPEGDVIVSLHQFYRPEWRVVAVAPKGTLEPYPTPAWSGPPGADGVGFDAVLGLRADTKGRVWMLDNGRLTGSVPKLVAWDHVRDRLHRVIHLPAPASAGNTFQNDLAVDLDHGAIYLADPAGGDNAALVVVDLRTGFARRLLEGHASIVPEDVTATVEGRPLEVERPDGSLVEPRVGINPITIDPASEWVYYGPMSGTSLYRIRTSHLLDESLSPAALGGRVERYGDKPVSAGITIDGAGNVYVADIGNKAIGVTRPDGSYTVWAQDDELLNWPDGLSFGPDNHVYATVNKLHLSAVLNAGEDAAAPPYYIVRMKALAPGRVGR